MKIYGVIISYFRQAPLSLMATELLHYALQGSLGNKSFVMDVYKAYNLPVLHPLLQKAFQYLLEGEYLALSSDSYYATIQYEHDFLICVLTKGHMSQLNTTVYPKKTIS